MDVYWRGSCLNNVPFNLKFMFFVPLQYSYCWWPVFQFQITILVAAEGVHKLPSINGSGDLKEALQKLGSIPSSRILVRRTGTILRVLSSNRASSIPNLDWFLCRQSRYCGPLRMKMIHCQSGNCLKITRYCGLYRSHSTLPCPFQWEVWVKPRTGCYLQFV